MSFKLEIISTHPRIEEGLKELCEKNKETLERVGFNVYYTKQDLNKYWLYVITTKMGSAVGMKLFGKRKIIKALKTQFKKFAPDADVKELRD